MKVFRLYCGKSRGSDPIPQSEIDAWLAEVAIGTIYESRGYWQGMAENSFVLELFDVTETAARAIARDYKDKFGQQAVAVVSQEVTLEWIA